MAKNRASNDVPDEITSVCTNYQELVNSEDFKRIIKIAVKKPGCFSEGAIMSIFEKLGKGEALSEQDKENLIFFGDNKNVEAIVTPILKTLSDSPISTTIQNSTELENFSDFLISIFSEDGFKTTRNGILEQAGADVSDRVLDTVVLSPEAQQVQENFNNWLDQNEEYAEEHKIAKKVEIKNDGIHLGGQVLRWKGHQFGGVNVQSDEDLKKQPYAIKQMVAMTEALGGEGCSLEYDYQIGGREVSSFLSKVANIELYRFCWSSTSCGENNDFAGGVVADLDGVYVRCAPRNSGYYSSWSS